MRICYDGDAFRRVLALPAQPVQKARAALALTNPDCADPALQPLQRHQWNRWRVHVLEQVEARDLPGHVRNRVALRRAAVWSTLAYEHTRLGEPAQAAAGRALAELASVQKGELAEEDQSVFNDAAMRVNAARWAAVAVRSTAADAKRPSIITQPGQPGETCVLLVDAKHDAAQPLARRCTYAVVWTQSASLNREGNALALAVQPVDGWRELWLFRKRGGQWSVGVVPPAALVPGIGYAEFAGWVPGGQQVLVAREARAEGRYRRSYEVVSLDSLAAQRQAGEAAALGPFQRWPDRAWKEMSLALR